VILELKNNLDQSGNSKSNSRHDAPVIGFDDWSFVNNLTTLTLREVSNLLPYDKSDSSGIRIQDVAWGDDALSFASIVNSPLEVGFVGSSYCVPTGSNANSNCKVTGFGFQNQTPSSVQVFDVLDADLNPAKRVSDADGFLGYFYAGIEKKDNHNPSNKQVKRERTQEGRETVHVKVESSNHAINQNHDGSANDGSHGTVLEILHNLSLSEEEVG
jgi:hypothetical protein